MAFDQKAANRWTARFIPIILIGIVAYATFVVVKTICVDYLLDPPPFTDNAQPGAAIAILIIYFILLIIMACTYGRLTHTIFTNPGYTERFSKENTTRKGPWWKRTLSGELSEESKNGMDNRTRGHAYPVDSGRPLAGTEAPGLDNFWGKDLFVCEGDGRPIWCSKCSNWKPDRTHHCREVDRCVRRMDHFCPWVGGIVGETNFKFFVQFTFWTALYCLHILIFVAIFLNRERKFGRLNIHWAVILGFASLFEFFTAGLTLSSLQFIFINTTSVENLSRAVKVYNLAIYMPRPPDPSPNPPFHTITYPLTQPGDSSTPSGPTRTFAILHTKPGENPWDLGPFQNFKQVMGEHWYDWLLPIKYSPLSNHDSGESDFPLGHVVQRLREEAGIAPPPPPPQAAFRRKSGRRKHRRSRNENDSNGHVRSSHSKHSHSREKRRHRDELDVAAVQPETDLSNGISH